ncbi:MAG: ATP-grasp fold amidoligase family protein [Pararhodobacter sp.]
MSDEDNQPIAFLVTLHGNVEGVDLRRRVRRAARKLGAKGWVRNRASGHMQMHIEGEEAAVRRLMANLVSGKICPDVQGMVSSLTDVLGYEDFDVNATRNRNRVEPAALGGGVHRARLLEKEFDDLGALIYEVDVPQAASEAENLATLATEVPPRYLREALLRKPSTKKKLLPFQLRNVTGSFTAEVWAQTIANDAMKKEGVITPARILNHKPDGMAYARRLGLRTPETYQEGVGLEEIRFAPPMVLKPVSGAGARDVFCIYSEHRILHVVSKQMLGSVDEMLAIIRQSRTSHRNENKWISEELIAGEQDDIANDVKAYCFYGRAEVILEINRTGDFFRYCWWDRNCEKLETGKYADKRLEGTSLRPEYVELAERVSLSIPRPFIRIDFLKSASGPVFGEFTPRPGNFQGFDAATDAWLGRCYAEARGRLMADLIKNKRFDEYEAFLAARAALRKKKKEVLAV